jgi:hypothetical protein
MIETLTELNNVSRFMTEWQDADAGENGREKFDKMNLTDD